MTARFCSISGRQPNPAKPFASTLLAPHSGNARPLLPDPKIRNWVFLVYQCKVMMFELGGFFGSFSPHGTICLLKTGHMFL